MFRTPRELLVGRSFRCLYPIIAEFEHTGARIVANLRDDGCYGDDREHPHEVGIWSFEDLSPRRPGLIGELLTQCGWEAECRSRSCCTGRGRRAIPLRECPPGLQPSSFISLRELPDDLGWAVLLDELEEAPGC